jgi:hypothetical protein
MVWDEESVIYSSVHIAVILAIERHSGAGGGGGKRDRET